MYEFGKGDFREFLGTVTIWLCHFVAPGINFFYQLILMYMFENLLKRGNLINKKDIYVKCNCFENSVSI